MKNLRIARPLLLLSGLLLVAPAHAGGQIRLDNQPQAETAFWNQLYPTGGTSLYCNEAFQKKSMAIDIDHVYSLKQLADHLKCPNLHACDDNPEFQRMAADLHNQYPALKKIIRSRRETLFGTVPGDQYSFPECQYKTSYQESEPRDSAKGNIARAILYMHVEYGLPIPGRPDVFRQWNETDPVDDDERARNNRIEAIQGNRNRFIDHPGQVEELYKF